MSAARTSLRQTQLDPRRRAIRGTLLYVALGLTTLVVVLVIFEQHRTPYKHYDWHPITDEENGLVALTALGLVGLALLGATQLGFVSGLGAGVASLAGGLIAVASIVLVHLLSGATHNLPGDLAMLGCLALSALGLAIFIVELVLRVNQRTDDLRESPETLAARLPKATLVERR
jgi:hypothetical protein